MTKKIALLMVVMLLASALVFVSCSQNTVPRPNTDDDDREPVENTVGDISDNLLTNGSFDSPNTAELSDTEDSGTLGFVDGALSVDTGTIDYGQVHIDLTKYYARGKSYYIQASFKNNGTTGKINMNANIDCTVVSGAVQDAVDRMNWEGYYSCPEIYEGGLLEEGDDALASFSDFLEDTTLDVVPVIANGLEINDTSFVTVGAILDAETIDMLLTNTTNIYSPGTTPTMYKMLVNFYVGDGKDCSGYKYLLDDIVIYDLNYDYDDEEGQYEGQTWTNPNDQA
jgi:hypothetical protein